MQKEGNADKFRFYLGRKGVSEIVAAVLIIMIVVAAGGIIAAVILPMVKNNLASIEECSNVQIRIDVDSGYTCTDVSKNRTIVMIKRGGDSANLSKLKLNLIKEGASYSAETIAPVPGQTITITINNTNFLPENVKVSPVVSIGRRERTCDVSSTAIVPSCTIEESFRPNEVELGQKYTGTSGGGGGGGGSTTPECTEANWGLSDGACVSGNLTRTWTKNAVCSGGVTHPATEIISCTSPCVDANWNSVNSTCVSGNLTRTWTKTGTCSGGVTHPASEILSCVSIPLCTGYGYSGWSDCNSSGKQIRSVVTRSPSGCEGGAIPVLIQDCTYCTEVCWGFALSPAICPITTQQTKTWTKNIVCSGGVTHPATETISCIYVDPLSVNLIAKYNFNEGTGSVLTDSSGKGNNGAISGAVWTVGHNGSGLNFDGNNDYVQIPTNGYLPSSGTISVWFNRAGVAASDYLFGHTTETWTNILQLYFLNDKITVGFEPTHVFDVGNGPTVNLNSWNQAALVWNATNYVLYYNGNRVLVGSHSPIVFSSYMDLGNDGNPTYRAESLNGKMDDVRVYNVSLNDSQILDIYNREFIPECTTNADCSDGIYCNGIESCSVSQKCLSGNVINCDDGNALTTDSCDENLNSCVNALITSTCPDLPGIDYYVSSINVNRSDSNVGTDCKRPWATFDKIKSNWTSIPAGSTIHLEKGSEWTWISDGDRPYFHMQTGGNQVSGPITIRGDDYGDLTKSKPILRRVSVSIGSVVISITKGGYVTIRDFIIDGGCPNGNSVCSTSVGTSGIDVSQNDWWGHEEGEIKNVTVKNMVVKNLGSSTSAYYAGIGFYPRSYFNISNCLIEGNDVSGYSSHGLNHYPNHAFDYGGRQGESNYMVWRNNNIHDPSPNRFGGAASGMHYSSGGVGNIIENNTFIGPNPQGSLMIDVFTGTDQGVIIRNNVFGDNSLGTGMVIWGAENTSIFNANIYNNIFYNNRYAGMTFQGVNNPLYGTLNIFNNIFFNNAYEIGDWYAEFGISGDYGFATLNIKNNIFSHSVGGDYSLRIANDFRGVINHNNNLFWDTRVGRISVQDYKNGNSFTLPNVRNFEPTAKNTSPNFVNVANIPIGLKLQSGSPAINSGADLGTAFNKAFDGVTRSGSWDIGAYEQ